MLKVGDCMNVRIWQRTFQEHSCYHESALNEWLLASHWRNFKVLGPARRVPILLVYSYFMVRISWRLPTLTLHADGSIHIETSSSGSAEMLGSLPPLIGASWFFPPLVNPTHSYSRLSSSMRPCCPPDFLAPDAYWHRWASLSWYFSYTLVTWWCVYVRILGYMPMCMDASLLKAITLFHVQVRFPISWQRRYISFAFIL